MLQRVFKGTELQDVHFNWVERSVTLKVRLEKRLSIVPRRGVGRLAEVNNPNYATDLNLSPQSKRDEERYTETRYEDNSR